MRRILALLVIALVATSVWGAAATLGVSARSLGAGSAVVGDCHTGPAPTVAYTYGTTNDVLAVKATGLAPTCVGGTAQATVADASGAGLASGIATVTATSATSAEVTVAFAAPGAPAADVEQYHLVIVKPSP